MLGRHLARSIRSISRPLRAAPSLRKGRVGRRQLSAAATLQPHWLVTYEFPEDVLEKRAPHRAAHLDLLHNYMKEGKIVLGGALANPTDKGLILCTSKEAAESFVENDPYATEGVALSSVIREWSIVNFE